jgi:hypothetical protein
VDILFLPKEEVNKTEEKKNESKGIFPQIFEKVELKRKLTTNFQREEL